MLFCCRMLVILFYMLYSQIFQYIPYSINYLGISSNCRSHSRAYVNPNHREIQLPWDFPQGCLTHRCWKTYHPLQERCNFHYRTRNTILYPKKKCSLILFPSIVLQPQVDQLHSYLPQRLYNCSPRIHLWAFQPDFLYFPL